MGRDEVEAGFLKLLREAPEDDTTRLVYADWLEGEGERERADFLRTVCKLAAPSVHRKKAPMLRERLIKLSSASEAAWRALVARPPIERCGFELRFRCPKRWTALAPTATPDVRRCGTCDRDVHFCTSIDEVRLHGQLGDCVAFDPALRSAEAAYAYDRERPGPAYPLEIEMGEVG
jgi:uncharacterized protein (TIGR02996 family)